ncbi:deoxyuridine 5'-triphosphate nucleotidohydrolase-like [Triticum dicoccoides]|uniref:deoxyuridine 5'-triphosphate nucleotidohydrolase-like n=1 Tax=Triticum dicoccoides TaxID=85692 RepID=UPI00188DE383|nr:deoxyuridine 5'-triphosphate nucleotidohydrolase-like [Triticum dicoccoides]
MAGELGAIRAASRPAAAYLFIAPRSHGRPQLQLQLLLGSSPSISRRRPPGTLPSVVAMAATNGAGADPVHEPPHKITNIAPLLKVKKLSDKAILPSRGSALAAGYDLSSAVETVVPARGKALVATDLSIAIPEGTYARIAPRSGLALKHAIDVGAGVIDADYRGPVGVVLFNHSEADFAVKPGDRVAQMIIQVIATPEVAEVEDLDATLRGEGGFGSTGV